MRSPMPQSKKSRSVKRAVDSKQSSLASLNLLPALSKPAKVVGMLVEMPGYFFLGCLPGT